MSCEKNGNLGFALRVMNMRDGKEISSNLLILLINNENQIKVTRPKTNSDLVMELGSLRM